MSNDLVLSEAGLRQVTCIVRERQLRLYGHVARLPAQDPAQRFFLVEIRGAGPCRGAPTCFMVASGGVLYKGSGHGGPGVCLGHGQTEAEGVPSQGESGDALLRRMPPYLTCGLCRTCVDLRLCT